MSDMYIIYSLLLQLKQIISLFACQLFSHLHFTLCFIYKLKFLYGIKHLLALLVINLLVLGFQSFIDHFNPLLSFI